MFIGYNVTHRVWTRFDPIIAFLREIEYEIKGYILSRSSQVLRLIFMQFCEFLILSDVSLRNIVHKMEESTIEIYTSYRSPQSSSWGVFFYLNNRNGSYIDYIDQNLMRYAII